MRSAAAGHRDLEDTVGLPGRHWANRRLGEGPPRTFSPWAYGLCIDVVS